MQTRNTPETPFTKLKRSREIWINGSASFQTMLKLLADTSCHEACIRSFVRSQSFWIDLFAANINVAALFTGIGGETG
jgi:hypothetical protein